MPLEDRECAAGTQISGIGNAAVFVESSLEDGGRSTEAGGRKQASNPLKLLVLRALVVSVEEKVAKLSYQVGYRETSYSEPMLTRRKPKTWHQNRGRFDTPGSVCR